MKDYNPLILKEENYFPHQWKFLVNKPKARIKCLSGGYGSGKTKIFLTCTILNLCNRINPKTGKSNGLILYPTYSLAEDVFVEPFREMLDKSGIAYEYNIASHKFRTQFGDLKVYVTNQSQKIVGSSYTYCGVDEIDIESYTHADRAISKALGRLRGCEDAELYITSTPEGYHWLYDFMVQKASPDKYLVYGKTTDNPYLPKSYIQSLRDNYDENLLKAYLEGKFTNLQKGNTYGGFTRDKNIRECRYDRTKPIHCAWDFNILPQCVCIVQESSNHPHIQVIDEIALDGDGGGDVLTDRMCRTIKERYPNARYYAYPDATGSSKHSSARFSDIDYIYKNGFMVQVRHINPLVINRVNSMNNNLAKGNIVIDPKCKGLIRDLEQVVNKQGTRDIDKSNKTLTHLSDALGYYTDFKWPAVRPVFGTQDRL